MKNCIETNENLQTTSKNPRTTLEINQKHILLVTKNTQSTRRKVFTTKIPNNNKIPQNIAIAHLFLDRKTTFRHIFSLTSSRSFSPFTTNPPKRSLPSCIEDAIAMPEWRGKGGLWCFQLLGSGEFWEAPRGFSVFFLRNQCVCVCFFFCF